MGVKEEYIRINEGIEIYSKYTTNEVGKDHVTYFIERHW